MAPIKKKAAFIDHSFHKITHSSDFIRELLSEKFDITFYYDESWIGGQEIDIEELIKNNYEYIFYWQYIHKAKYLKELKKSKIIFFPMEDSILCYKNLDWLYYGSIPIKIVCFSKNLYEKLKNFNLDCFYTQYYVNPDSLHAVDDYSSKRIYFWNRTKDINWNTIKKIVGNNSIDSILFMAIPDPNKQIQLPNELDIRKYNIKIIKKFLEKKEYDNLVSKANIYIAPRKYEGIGMSFIEALARGQCVIAPDSITMNEYIENGINGYLYDLKNEIEIDLRNFESVAKEARKKSFIGYGIWKNQRIQLLQYIFEKNIGIFSILIIFAKIEYFKLFGTSKNLLNNIIQKIKTIIGI